MARKRSSAAKRAAVAKAAATRRRRKSPLYFSWAQSYAEKQAAKTGRLMSPAEVQRDPVFKKAVDTLIKSGRRASHKSDSRLGKAAVQLGLRRSSWDYELGDSPTELVGRWNRSRRREAERAIKRREAQESIAKKSKGPAKPAKRGKATKSAPPKRKARKSAAKPKRKPARKPARKSVARKVRKKRTPRR